MPKTRTARLWSLFVLQAICAAFFAFDAGTDLLGMEASLRAKGLDALEVLVAATLVVSLVATFFAIQDHKRREHHLRQQLAAASGALGDYIARQFSEWGLSAAEREVAMLSIKGMSIAEMAALRNSREGTIKSQAAAVYRKAGVSGRHQLLSYFIEELLADPLMDQG